MGLYPHGCCCWWCFRWQVEAFGKGEFEIELPEAKQKTRFQSERIPSRSHPSQRILSPVLPFFAVMLMGWPGFERPEDVLDHIMRVSVATMLGKCVCLIQTVLKNAQILNVYTCHMYIFNQSWEAIFRVADDIYWVSWEVVAWGRGG